MHYSKNVAVCLEHRFYQVGNDFYTKLSFPYYYWKDYLTYFDHVTVIARAKKVSKVEEGMVLVNGENVDFYPLPYYIGIKQFVPKVPSLLTSLYKASSNHSHFLLRSGNATNILFFILLASRKPFIREYPGNIEEGIIGFAGGGMGIKLLAKSLNTLAKLQARSSKANSFVSEYCRELYGSNKPSIVFSSFKSSEISIRKSNYKIGDKIHLVSMGRLEGEKGHINLLKALNGLTNVHLHLIGDGSQRETLCNYALENNIDVTFYGMLTDRNKIFSIICDSDIFIIPSFTEGMPRALLEAMTMGLPCIGSNVGGIPEVLEVDALYDSKNIKQLAERISNLIDDQYKRELMGQRNRDFVVDNYSDEALSKKKHRFWSKLYE
ncbi:hypothetical protein CXF58_01735 [Psychrobacter sp. Sarcosine-02u-2]|uniref:glycosyltransferase family 4 protein n=1 Tax=Psychrobacter sp. Sarcosine-02u-2 TaxID=2058324 RepID=UPI000C7D5C5D|nr:glycosyltransferase family 4 protein [Psychrobacter sp. Sarcosine-02u-2]PKG88821.1 hypothetical protein CXF58_01735 [Psychrobacter sp. Sarcosine-02u-2]